MDSLSFIHGLQLTDSFFPVGAFVYSDGLETAAAGNHVHDAATLGEWMEHFLESVFIPCEGLALAKCMRALAAEDFETLANIDLELTALKPAASVRASSKGVGKRLLSLYSATCGDETFEALTRKLPEENVANVAVAYALVFWHRGLPEREATLAFGYNRLTGIVSAGLRLISIGHQQGQILLTTSLSRLPDAVDRILQNADEPLRSFSPMLDIQQMNHQYVYSRLFRS
jgi:urease accessory protein